MGMGVNLMNAQYKMDTLPLSLHSLCAEVLFHLAWSWLWPWSSHFHRLLQQNPCFHTGTADCHHPHPHPLPTGPEGENKDQTSG